MDIFLQIAFDIDNPQTLFNFAIASKATLMASISRLRYPQCVSQYPIQTGCWLGPSGAIFLHRLKDSNLFPAAFEVAHDEAQARRGPHHWSDVPCEIMQEFPS